MTAGRRRKPTRLHVVNGNPGHRPLPENEPEPPADMPPRPSFLDAYAIEEWDLQGPQLYALGILTVVDGAVFGAYCMAYSRWRRAEEDLAKEARLDDKTKSNGAIIKTTSGNLIQNPLVGIANSARRDMVRIAAEFGLTPSSRANLEAGKREGDETDKKYFGKS